MKRFCLVSDESGHSYVIPADQKDHWYNVWYESSHAEDGIVPVYARRTEGDLTFTDPQVGYNEQGSWPQRSCYNDGDTSNNS
jgi:hypothetical protein